MDDLNGRWRQAREALLAAERDSELLGADPELLRQYAGQWVAIQDGRIVASAQKGLDLAKAATLQNYPHLVVRYVPTVDEQEGVHILGIAFHDAT